MSTTENIKYEIPIADLYTHLIFGNEIEINNVLYQTLENYSRVTNYTGGFVADLETTILSLVLHFNNEEDALAFGLRFDKEIFRSCFFDAMDSI